MKKTQILAGAASVALIALAGSGSASAGPQPADLVLRHGYVVTVDAKDSVRGALAIRGGKIIYVGNDAGLAAYIGKATKVVDLHGRMAMPGLVDGHMHPAAGGAQLRKCSMNYEPLTIAQFQGRIQDCLNKTRDREPDGLLEVVNWFQQSMLPSGTEATRETLDALQTRRPIAVTSSFGHSTLVNTRAMQLANITAATPDPLGGKVVHDATGGPSGILEDAAQSLVNGLRPKPTEADDIAAVQAALAALREQGVTSFLDAAGSPAAMAAFAAIQKQGGLTARAHFAPVIPPPDGPQPQKAVAAVKALAQRYDQGPIVAAPTMTVRNVKLFLDGVITAPAFTGTMLAPYFANHGTADHPQWGPGTNKGPPVYFPLAVLAPLLEEVAAAGLDPHIHAGGDAAVRVALDGIAAMRAKHPGKDIRPAVAHVEIADPADFKRFKQLNALPVLSFQWAKPASDTIDGAKDYMGPDRFKFMEPEGYLFAAGARIAYGSDWPVDPLNEWFALKVGVTRTNDPSAGPKYAGRLSTDPGLSRKTVVRAITLNASYELHQDTWTGSLEKGKLADVIVLDRNLFKIPAEQIADIKVLMTIVGGKIVYQAAGAWPGAGR